MSPTGTLLSQIAEVVAVACCVAAGLLIAFVRKQWFRVFPGRAPQQADFAPPARRAAPAPTREEVGAV
jgi:hypothetical protein